MKIIRGIKGVIEQKPRITFTQGRGWSTARVFHCTDVAAAQMLNAQLITAGYNTTRTIGDPVDIIEATISRDDLSGGGGTTTEVPTNTWEKTVVTVQKDILETAYAKSQLNDNDFEVLTKAKANGGEITDAEFESLSLNGQDFYQAIVSGVTSFTIYQPILRHVQVVSTGYPLNWPTTNDGRILTNAQLVSLEGLPNDLRFALPGSVFSADFLVGWLKIPATIQQSGISNWTVTQEFQYGEWLPLLYGAA